MANILLLFFCEVCYAELDMASPERLHTPDAELSPFALILAQNFIQRWDCYAQQRRDGRYVCIHEMLNVGHLFAHLRGEITLGTYILDPESRARFVVFDADDGQSWQQLGYLARNLAGEGVPAYLEGSRRGGHLWLFFPDWVPGVDAREFGRGVLSQHGATNVELYPKQDRLSDGPGSLIRLPFGVHRLTGYRYPFCDANGVPLASTLREQLRILSAPQTVPNVAFDAYRTFVSPAVIPPVSEPQVQLETLSERIKTSVSVLDFVSQYVDLTLTASGAIGLCPFHDDHHPSFGVNVKGNYWNCFAGCGGGSVIDFLMRWKGCDFTTAVRELAKNHLEYVGRKLKSVF